MTNFEKNLKQAAKEIRMSHAEKGAMRLRLAQATRGSASSPYFFYSFHFMSATRYALATLLLIVFVSGSTVSAAQGALPGDVLYPVKISVNERVELAFATTPEAKFYTEVRLAERRASEAQALDEKGRLNATTTIEIEREFNRHASNALALAESVSSKGEVTAPQTSESEGGEGESMALKTTEGSQEDTATMMMVASTPSTTATGTATTSATTEFQSRDDDWLASLEAKREILRELRQRAERREWGEVHGAFDSRDNNDGDSKKSNSDDGHDENGKDGGNGDDGESGKSNDD